MCIRDRLYADRAKTTAMELMWCLKCVAADYSFASCNGLHETFQVSYIMSYSIQLEKAEPESEKKSIDLYGTQFFNKTDPSVNTSRFPTVERVVKASLSLSHGNADVERAFSTSGRTLTSTRSSMSERTLNALITVKSALKMYDNKPYLISLTPELLSMGRLAYKQYICLLYTSPSPR